MTLVSSQAQHDEVKCPGTSDPMNRNKPFPFAMVTFAINVTSLTKPTITQQELSQELSRSGWDYGNA